MRVHIELTIAHFPTTVSNFRDLDYFSKSVYLFSTIRIIPVYSCTLNFDGISNYCEYKPGVNFDVH